MLVIDGTYLIYKSYYRAKKNEEAFQVTNSEHFTKIARNIFLRSLAKIKNNYKPSFLFVVFDAEGKNFRDELLPTYKANRKEKPSDLYDVKNEVYNFLDLHQFSFQVADNVEGDDLIASYVKQNPLQKTTIFTGDSDMGAVVTPNASLLLERRKKIKLITHENFHHFFLVPPSKTADYKALKGDKSDFLKGVDGLFRTEALHLLMEFSTLEEFFEKGTDHYLFSKLAPQKEKILINKKVACLKTDCVLHVDLHRSDLKNLILPEKIAQKVGW